MSFKCIYTSRGFIKSLFSICVYLLYLLSLLFQIKNFYNLWSMNKDDNHLISIDEQKLTFWVFIFTFFLNLKLMWIFINIRFDKHLVDLLKLLNCCTGPVTLCSKPSMSGVDAKTLSLAYLHICRLRCCLEICTYFLHISTKSDKLNISLWCYIHNNIL